MRHTYKAEAIVLSRVPHGEASADLILLTRDFGIIRARAQGLRHSGAKLSASLQTFCVCTVMLVRGKDIWRVSGATVLYNRAEEMKLSSRLRAGRVTGLLLRLAGSDTYELASYDIIYGFFDALIHCKEEEQEAAECLAVLRLLRHLGLDAGDIPGELHGYDAATLSLASASRSAFITRINRGIAASGL